MEPLLPKINSPVDLRKLPKEELPRLAREVRDFIIETVADKGGHLGAGLGVTDLTIALHYLLDTPNDFLVWDVGHQVQAHKILTGRRDAFRQTFRQYKGVSGLVNSGESPYDVFTTGHGGPSISAALGVAAARRRQGQSTKVVAVIGDTSIASGMALEAMNHAGHIRENLVVILNDNEMSISKSVGAMSRYLNQVITNPTYNHLRDEVESLIGRMPKVGGRVLGKIKYIEEGVKHLLVPGQLFENLGFRYFGPLDGHNFESMLDLFPKIFAIQGPVLIHVVTKKGKGMPMAEIDPIRWHASAPFDIKTGELKKKSTELSYTEVFGRTLYEMAETNSKIVALTGGMPEGTGLVKFGQRFPERLFDVGISEEHGITFCAGLAYGGMRPFATVYSTFMQRAFDQIVHDIALQNLPVIFAMDRGGLVGEDGPTHHGVLDISFMRKIPNMTVLAPRDGKEFVQMLHFAAGHTAGPVALRYPRGSVTELLHPELERHVATPIEKGKAEVLREGTDVMLFAYGAMVGPALEVAQTLEQEGLSAGVVNARFAKPLDEQLLLSWAQKSKLIVTLEEGCLPGGYGSAVLETLAAHQVTIPVLCLGIPDRFIEHGPRNILLDICGLSPKKIISSIRATFQNISSPSINSSTLSR